MDNVDLYMKSETRYPWIMFAHAKPIISVNRCHVIIFHEKLKALHACRGSFFQN